MDDPVGESGGVVEPGVAPAGSAVDRRAHDEGVVGRGAAGVGVSLRDELTGEQIDAPAGRTVAELIEWRCATADHPRADFRSRRLHYALVGADGEPLAADTLVEAGAVVTLASPDAAEVRERRDRWIADIDERGVATVSMSASTHLVLIERTGSRLADVARLRDVLATRRAAEAEATSSTRRWPLLAALGCGALAVGLAIVAAVALTRGDDTSTVADAEGGTRATGGGTTEDPYDLPVELELELAAGTTDRTAFHGGEGQNVTILMLAPRRQLGPGIDSELELYDPDGVQIGYNDDRQDIQGGAVGNSLNSRIDITLPADGVYEVVSGDLSDSGSGAYTLIIEEGGPGGDGFVGGFRGDVAMAVPDEAFEVAEEEAPGAAFPPPWEWGCEVIDGGEADLPTEIGIPGECEVVRLVVGIGDAEGGVVVEAADGGPPIEAAAFWAYGTDGLPHFFTEDAALFSNGGLPVELPPGDYELYFFGIAPRGAFEVTVTPLTS